MEQASLFEEGLRNRQKQKVINIREKNAKERIDALRCNILVHSYIYYRKNTHLIKDKEFDKRCKELVKLQEEYP